MTSSPARPLRVLHTVRGLGVNGITNVVARTVSRLAPFGVHSEVCSLFGADALAGTFRVMDIDPAFLGHRGPADVPRTVGRLVRLIRERHVDVVHTNQTIDFVLAGLAARRCGVPLVASIHWLAEPPADAGGAPRRFGRIEERIRATFERRLATRIIAVSEAVRATHVAALGDAFALDRVTVIHPGIEPTPPAPDAAAVAAVRRDLGFGEADPLLVNVARLDPSKGQWHLIPMMQIVRQRLPDARLIIAGDGSVRGRLERDIAASGQGDAIRLLGMRLDVDELLSASDLLVLASEREAVGLPLLEAMRLGKPVVATRIGGVPEIVEDGVTGRLAPPADPEALAAAVVEVLTTPGAAERMGAAGRRLVAERFDAADSARRLAAVYRSLVGAPATAVRA